MRPRLLSMVKSLVAMDVCTLKHHLLHDSSCATNKMIQVLTGLPPTIHFTIYINHLQVLDRADGSASLPKCALLLRVSRKASAAAPHVIFQQQMSDHKCFVFPQSNRVLSVQAWSKKLHLQVFQLRLLLGIELC